MIQNQSGNRGIPSGNLGLKFGIFAIGASIVIAWMMYYLPPVVPPLKVFLFPVVILVFGLEIIFESLGRLSTSHKLMGLAFILLSVAFMSIFNNAPWYAVIIPILFIIAGLVILYQSFFLKK